MNEFNLTFDEKQNASKLEKDLLQRTLDLKSLMDGTANSQVSLRNDYDLLKIQVEAYEVAFNVLNTKHNLLHLQVSGKITQDQRDTLLKMLDSVDKENHVVAMETINNLME